MSVRRSGSLLCKAAGGGREVFLHQHRDPAKAMMVASPDGAQREGKGR